MANQRGLKRFNNSQYGLAMEFPGFPRGTSHHVQAAGLVARLKSARVIGQRSLNSQTGKGFLIRLVNCNNVVDEIPIERAEPQAFIARVY
ncbi:MAG: hypothetical protein ACI8TQ_000403 [Planctomycetota bacterium]|jgi:hypothetical protein